MDKITLENAQIISEKKSAYKKSSILKYKKTSEFLALTEELRNYIKIGEIKAGDMMWTENYISQRFQVNRTIAKKSLAVLLNEGLIYTIPGKGNFVCKQDTELYELKFNEMSVTDENTEEIRIIEINVVKPSFEVTRELRITGKKLVVEIKRVFMNQKKAEIFEIKYIPYFRGVPIVEQAIGNDIFSEKLVTKCSKFVATKKIEIKIAPISGEVCDILNMDEGSMLLLVEQKQFDEKNNPVEWCRQYFSGNSDRLCAIASCY